MRIKTIFLSLLLALNVFSQGVLAADSVDTATVVSDASLEFLEMLGITEGINTDDMSRSVSRGEFASMTVNMTNLSTVTTYAADFADVDIDDGFGAKIYDALYLGIVSRSSNDMFYPDDAIAYEPAVKMVVEGLGYGKKAQLYGGYPAGYIRVASELGILSGVNRGMTLSDAVTLVSNALLANVWIVDGITEDTTDYKTQDGRTLLTENFGLSYTSGIVTTAGLYSANYAYDSLESKMEISAVMYDCDIKDAGKYLGYSVEAWYDDNGTIKALIPETFNSDVTVYGKDVSDYSSLRLTVDEGDKEKKYSLDSGYTYILNGRLHDQTDEDFRFENGKLTLIDNDGDRKYDFVIADRHDYFLVNSIDELGRILYDNSNGIKTVDMRNDGTKYCEVELYNFSKKTTSSATFDTITPGSLLEVKVSGDEQLVLVTLLAGNSVSGKVEEQGEDYIIIGGETYKLADYLAASGEKIVVGQSATFLLSTDGRIVAKTDKSGTMLYGYYLDFASAKGLGKPQIKILDTDSKVVTYDVSDKVKLNNGADVVAEDIRSQLIDASTNTPVYQVIKYCVNAKGELSAIDIATDAPSGGNVVTDLEEGNSLVRYVSQKSVRYKSSNHLVVPYGRITSSVVFYVPKSLADDTVAPARYDDEFFVSGGTSRLDNDDTPTIDLYDYSENYVPAVAVVYNMIGGASSSEVPSTSAESYMVDKVTNALDSDGNSSVKITLCSLGSYQSYVLNCDVYEELKEDNDLPQKGDIIRYVLDSKNEIVGIARDVVFDSKTKTFSIAYGEDGVKTNISDLLTYASGTVKAFGGGLMTLDLINIPTYIPSEIDLSDNQLSYGCNATKAVLYSGADNSVRVINAADIKTEANCGAGDADMVVLKTVYYNAPTVFVYRDN